VSVETRTADRSGTPARTRFPESLRAALRLSTSALLAVCSVWSITRLAGVDRVPSLTTALMPVLAFTPYAAVLSAVPLIGAVALRRWVACSIAVAVTGGFAVAVLPRALPDAGAPAKGPLLRVLTANLHFGRADPRVLVDLARRSRVELLSLQEFTAASQVALDRAGLRTLLPHRLTKPIGGALGSGLYSRYPLRALSMPDRHVVGLAMPRAEVEVPGGGQVQITAVHLAKPMSPAGATQWAGGLAAAPSPQAGGAAVRILAGDFNSTLDNALLRRFIAAGYVDAADAVGAGLTPTFQRSAWPPLTIDHVLIDTRCAVRRVTVHRLPLSDHRAVFTELRLP
jgi:endonuclease/exonuclease/phosphatase (EEP) superfamily protein YafD